MTHATGEPPQDAPTGQPWPGWPQAGTERGAEPAPGSQASGASASPLPPDVSPSASPLPPDVGPQAQRQHDGPSAVSASAGASVAPGYGAAAVQRAPTGPNWGLAAVGLLLVLAAGAQLAFLLGYRPDPSVRFGPQVLIALGAVLLLVGAVGSLARRASAAKRRPFR